MSGDPPASPFELLSPGTLRDIVSRVQEGFAEPDEARRLLFDVATRISAGVELPEDLLEYLRGAITAYLRNPTDAALLKALGLRRRTRGQPKKRGSSSLSAGRQQMRVALSMWNHLLNGTTYEDTVRLVGRKQRVGATKASEAWRAYAEEALVRVRLSRQLQGKALTAEENARIQEIRSASHFMSAQPPGEAFKAELAELRRRTSKRRKRSIRE